MPRPGGCTCGTAVAPDLETVQRGLSWEGATWRHLAGAGVNSPGSRLALATILSAQIFFSARCSFGLLHESFAHLRLQEDILRGSLCEYMGRLEIAGIGMVHILQDSFLF